MSYSDYTTEELKELLTTYEKTLDEVRLLCQEKIVICKSVQEDLDKNSWYYDYGWEIEDVERFAYQDVLDIIEGEVF